MSNWNVYYKSYIHSNEREGNHLSLGKEIPLNKTFTWGGNEWKVLSMYSFLEGPVFHICKGIDIRQLRDFYSKWPWLMDKEAMQRYEIPEDEVEKMRKDSPYTGPQSIEITINGQSLNINSSCSDGWNPMDDEKKTDALSHYCLDPAHGWLIICARFQWVGNPIPMKDIKSIQIRMIADPVSVPGPQFTIKEEGEEFTFCWESTGICHTLKVLSYRQIDLGNDSLTEDPDDPYEYPQQCVQMTYSLTPDLSDEVFSVEDSSCGDSPRSKEDGREVCNAGMPAIFFDDGLEEDSNVHSASSALYFDPPEKVQWRMVFHEKIREDFTLTLQAGKDFDII